MDSFERMNEEEKYYRSNAALPFIGKEGQTLLSAAKVLVIGAGGLGCPCLQALAGAGVGHIGIADDDTVDISNLHRQQLYNVADAGKLKAVLAAERLRQYNPFIQLSAHQLRVDEQNIISLIAPYHIIADCTDNFYSRYLVNDAAVLLNKPLVYGAIHREEAHVTVFNYNGSATLRCLFPKDDTESIASCAEIGAYSVTTAIAGNLMAGEIIKMILQQEAVLADRLLQVNVREHSSVMIRYTKSGSSYQKSIDRFNQLATKSPATTTAVFELVKNTNSVLIDVRNAEERSACSIGGEHIPLEALLTTTIFPFEKHCTIVVYCERGNRSASAVKHLQILGFSNAVSLPGGIQEYLRYIQS